MGRLENNTKKLSAAAFMGPLSYYRRFMGRFTMLDKPFPYVVAKKGHWSKDRRLKKVLIHYRRR